MNKTIKKWFVFETILSIGIGTLLHFVYDWSNQNGFVSIFGAVNESTWEHLKLLFWPVFFMSIIEYFVFGYKIFSFFRAKAMTLYIGMVSIILLFYGYMGIFGFDVLFFDIALFVVSIIIGEYFGYTLLIKNPSDSKNTQWIAILSICLLVLMFIIFTFNPPHIPLFQDPNTLKYGR